MQKTFKTAFEKIAFNAKALLNTIPKATQSVGAASRPLAKAVSKSSVAPGKAAVKETVQKAVPTPPVKAPDPATPKRTAFADKPRTNTHADYLRSIGAIGKASKNEGMVLKYSPSGAGGSVARKSQFESISPVGKPPIGPDRGPLK